MIQKAIQGDILPISEEVALHPFCGREAELLGTQELPHPLNSGHVAGQQCVVSHEARNGCDWVLSNGIVSKYAPQIQFLAGSLSSVSLPSVPFCGLEWRLPPRSPWKECAEHLCLPGHWMTCPSPGCPLSTVPWARSELPWLSHWHCCSWSHT